MVFADEAKIEASELADFLFCFRGVYAAGIQVVGTLPAADVDPVELSRLTRDHLGGLSVSEINDLFRKDLGTNRLLTERITHDSPTELVISGMISAILVAVILSGGTFELGGLLKISLRPIGEGIGSLREALTSRIRTSLGYGVNSKVVILSKEELALLMVQDPAEKGKGGYQRFLVGLQKRVVRKTRELELSEKDMNFIIRAIRKRSKGGFQGRIYKIFARHFGFGEQG